MKEITIRLEDSDFKKIVSAKQKFEAEINKKLPIEEYLTLLIENQRLIFNFTLPFLIIGPIFLIILIYSEDKNNTKIKKKGNFKNLLFF